jgi:hypothetical protein
MARIKFMTNAKEESIKTDLEVGVVLTRKEVSWTNEITSNNAIEGIC